MDDQTFFTTIAGLLNIPSERVSPETNLRDLVQDSFALVEVVIDLQDTLGVAFTQTDFRDVVTVRDLAMLFAGQAPPASPGAGQPAAAVDGPRTEP